MTSLLRSLVSLSLCLLVAPTSYANIESSPESTAQPYPPLSHLPAGSRSALRIENLVERDTALATDNQDQYFPPASTLKLLTALAAKLELDDNFRFETHLATAGQDWVIQFSGDPTLMSQDLNNLLALAKRDGRAEIKGDLWLDNRAFTGYDRAVGWPWDSLGVCYSAPASAISLDENCVYASIYTQDDGKTRVYVPEQYPIYVTSGAKSVSQTEQQATQCDLELLSSPDNHYQLQGCLTQREKPLPLKFAVQDPELYTQRMVSQQLRALGITLKGQIRIGQPPAADTQRIATHRSAPLSDLIATMLTKSDNLIADSLTKTLGAKFYIQPGSFSNGTKAIKQIIFAHTGIDLTDVPMTDGSGLSRNNRITTAMMAKVLRYIWQHDEDLNLIAAMPKSGENGTLQYRRSMRQSPIKGALVAKSGSIYGSMNMAGFGLDEHGTPTTLFIQFVADYHPGEESRNAPRGPAAITQFETLFYQDVVNFSQAMPKNALTTVK